MQKSFPTIVNYVFHARDPHGDTRVFATAEARNAALKALRENAIESGLSASSARSGIEASTISATDLSPGVRAEVESDELGEGVRLAD